jgi:hypothetical protein
MTFNDVAWPRRPISSPRARSFFTDNGPATTQSALRFASVGLV